MKWVKGENPKVNELLQASMTVMKNLEKLSPSKMSFLSGMYESSRKIQVIWAATGFYDCDEDLGKTFILKNLFFECNEWVKGEII